MCVLQDSTYTKYRLIYRQKADKWSYRGLEGRMECKAARKIFFEDEGNVLYLDCDDNLWAYTLVKIHWIVYFEWMQLTVCKLIPNKGRKGNIFKFQFLNNFIFSTELKKLFNSSFKENNLLFFWDHDFC